MSIYRKDNNGNIKKIAGLFIKTYNTKWFNVTRSIENGLEIYTLNNEDLEYFEYIQTRSIFNLNFTEPNTTTTPKLRIGTRTFDIYSLINTTGEIPVGILSSIVQFYFGATLDNNRVYINDYILLSVDDIQNDLDAVVANTTLISTESGGFKAGKDITAESDGIGIGNTIDISYPKCIAIGQSLSSDGEGAILIGSNNQARDELAVIIGNNSSANRNGIAIGDNAYADSEAVQLGAGSNNTPGSLQFKSKRIIDGSGNLYENNIKLNELYVRKTFLQNLYLSRTDALSANIISGRPIASAANYMTMSTTNTQLDYNSTTKLTLTRVLQSSIQLTNDLELLVKLSFALNRNAQLEFGGRVLIDGVPISDNQAFGLNSYEGDSSYTGVVDTEFGIRLNLINEVQEFQAGQTLTVELFTRQVSNSTLVTRYYCGVNVGGVDRHSFIDINTITTSLDTNNIEDGAITTPKIAGGAVTEDKLSTEVQNILSEVGNLVDGTTPAGDSDRLGGVAAASYAQLSQVIRTDTSQSLTYAQKLQAQNNLGIMVSEHKSVEVGTQGWHNLLEISSNAKGTCFISHGYNYKQPFIAAFDFSIAVGYSYNITITAAGQGTGNSGIYKLRFAQINGKYYIQLYFPHTQSETFQVAAYIDSDVYPCIVLDNTVTEVDSQNASAEIEIKKGINTTGKIYENGGRVLSVNSSDLSNDEKDVIKNNIGINTSVTNTQRVFANYAISGSSTSWKKIASFNVGDFNIHMKIYGGLGNNKLVREVNFSGVNGTINSADSWEFYSTDIQIYYVYRDKAENYAWIDVYAKFGGYWKYYIEVEATGCGLAEKGNTSEISSLPSGSIKIPVKQIISIDPTIDFITGSASGIEGWIQLTFASDLSTLEKGVYLASIDDDMTNPAIVFWDPVHDSLFYTQWFSVLTVPRGSNTIYFNLININWDCFLKQLNSRILYFNGNNWVSRGSLPSSTPLSLYKIL